MELHSVEILVKTLNDAKVQYLIVGGLAVNAHGFARFTRDVDLVLGLEPDNALRGLQALLNAGWQLAVPINPADFADAAARERWRRDKNMIVLKLWSDQHQRTPVDIFIYEPFDFAPEWARAEQFEISPRIFAPVVTLNTLLQMKREADRPQDREDIQELTSHQ